MIEQLLTRVSAIIIAAISSLGYGGVILLMAMESACIPLPSEMVMPFAGYLVSTGRFHLQLVALAGALGCLLGSFVAYYVGASGGRLALERYGRYVLISHRELAAADRFFARFGSATVFVARLLPVIRTFIALPAGVARMELWRFAVYTLAGSYLWCLALAYGGMTLGLHWKALAPWIHRFDSVVVMVIVLGVALFLYSRLRGSISPAAAPGNAP